MPDIRSVLIVGGGTAGWVTACYLARALGTAAGGVRITLVESPEIGILGVGEGTFPTIRNTLAAIGIDEARFLRATTGTFKQGVKFVDWLHAPGTPGATHYFHPFNQPSAKPGAPALLPYWLLGEAGPSVPLAEAVTLQKWVADAARAPKRITDADYHGQMNYAYHFDAARFAGLLAEHGRSLGVQHVLATVERAERDGEGAIARVVTREHGALAADLYIDCSGFRAILIGDALGVPFHGLDDVLFADRAVAMQVPYERPDAPIASYTISTAREAGWIWDIGLRERRGIGYVYSSRHTGDARAEEVLRTYIGAAAADLPARKLAFRTGYRETQWVKNCVAVGLSGGFFEPLESTGIGLVEMAAYLIAHLFPFNGETEAVARQFNEQMAGRYRRIVDFIKLHYCLTRRTDSAFWIDNADPATIPDTLKDKLAMWRCRPPHRLDFVTDLEMFQPSSWQFILYGMEYATDLSHRRGCYDQAMAARREFETIRHVSQRAIADLPPHRMLIEQINAQGLQPVGTPRLATAFSRPPGSVPVPPALRSTAG